MPIEARLDAIQERQAEIVAWIERVEATTTQARLETNEILLEMRRLNGSMRDVLAEIGGAPDYRARGDRKNLRSRIHGVEQDSAAVRLLGQGMIDQMKELGEAVRGLERSRDTEQTREQAREQALAFAKAARDAQWSTRQKVGLFAFAFIGALGTLVSMIVLVTQ